MVEDNYKLRFMIKTIKENQMSNLRVMLTGFRVGIITYTVKLFLL